MNRNLHLETLYRLAQDYLKTSLEIFKYNAILKSSDIVSSLAVFITIFIAMAFSILFASVALAFWIGDYMGKMYYGFFAVAILYICFSVLFYFIRNRFIKDPIYNSLLKILQKK